MIRLTQIKLPIAHDESMIRTAIFKNTRMAAEELISYKIVKRSLDARKKPTLFYVYVIDVESTAEKRLKKKFDVVTEEKYKYETSNKALRPIVVGFGPAGMFAAHTFAKMGLKPIVLERGEAVEDRTLSVQKFWKEGILNTESNVQFGEGGAGTFSDGKLTTRSKDTRAKQVLKILVEHGAPEEILYTNKPHVGTDVLKNVVISIRKEIVALGGEIHFNTCVDNLILEEKSIKGVNTNRGRFMGDHVVLAIGHSARDTYTMLYENDMVIEQKAFAMGLRIEHLQETIDINQYGGLEAREHLGAADYKLTHKSSNGRSVYSFCVCPGGMVVASASEEGGIVVNGMSEHARDKKNINAALLVQIRTEDFKSEHPLAGVDFQRKYERSAFELTSGYNAPAQSVASFIEGKRDEIVSINPSYRPGIEFADLSKCLPEFVTMSLKEGIKSFGRKIKGYDASDAILTGVETRSSAPIRMQRDRETMESNIKGLFPVGEGAGYAGGIISSAIDGIRIAETIAID